MCMAGANRSKETGGFRCTFAGDKRFVILCMPRVGTAWGLIQAWGGIESKFLATLPV